MKLVIFMDDETFRNVDVTITVELGSTTMTLRELRTLDKTVELDQNGDDPVLIKANGAVIAHGEVVTVDDSYGVRITEMNP